MNAWGVFALLTGLLLVVPTAASGQEAKGCGLGGPWVRLQASGLPPAFRTQLLLQIRSSLAARRMDVCVSEDESLSRPLATLEVTPVDTETMATTLVVHDGVTRKKVARDLDLRGMPEDGRALAIALGLDELLRASWAELMLSDSRPSVVVPEVVAVALRPRERVERERVERWELGAAVAGEHFGAGHDQLGPNVVGRYAPRHPLGVHARFGLRAGFAVRAPRGAIQSTGLVLTSGLSVALVPRAARLGVQAELVGEGLITRVTFVASPSQPRVIGNEESVVASYLVMGARLSAPLFDASIKTFAQVGVGAPLHTAYAKDGDVRITGMGGPLVAGELGLSWAF